MNATEPRCTRCHERWAQFKGLCRTCGRETGVYTLDTFEADRQRVEHRRARLTLAAGAPASPRPVRMIEGVEYEVVWDGS